MVGKPVRLNKKQADVLVWIRDGCPDGIFVSGYTHRIVARALEQRGLVAIKGRGPSWSATVTETGREWRDVAPRDEDVPTVEAEAERLIAEVLGAGGSLPLPEGREAGKTYEQLVRRSLKSSVRPKGKKLEIVRKGPWGQGPGAIVFTEHFDDYVDAMPVPVPERVPRYHPAVKAFIQNKEWQYVTGEHVPRAGRVLQALANEATNRGIEALRPQDTAKHSKDPGKMHLALRTRAGAYLLQIREISGPGTQRVSRRLWNETTNQSCLDGSAWLGVQQHRKA